MNIMSRKIARDLTVHLVQNLNEIRDLRAEWDDLHKRDPQAGHFLSWTWMMQGFQSNPDRVTVLVARDDSIGDKVVGIMPLKSRVHWSKSRSEFETQYEAGGRLSWSEYTGFICDPDWEAAALQGFAMALEQMPWSTLSLRYVDQIERIETFKATFPEGAFSTEFKPYLINKGQTNNLVSPQVALPESFDQFLTDALSANSRQKFRRAERKYLNSGELRLTDTTQETFDEHLKILLDFWMRKWTPAKGKTSAAKITASYRQLLRSALDTGTLFLLVLWRGSRPLGALAHVIDPGTKKLHFIVVGRDLDADAAHIGQILHLGSIEWAIAYGYRVYDFGHGDEPYKYSYGTSDCETRYFTVRRRKASSALSFDKANTREALTRVQEFLKKKQYDRARQGCEQIVAALSED